MAASNLHTKFKTTWSSSRSQEKDLFMPDFCCGFGEKDVLLKVKLSLLVRIFFIQHKDIRSGALRNLKNKPNLIEEHW